MQWRVLQVQALQQKAKEENCEVVVVSAQVLLLLIIQSSRLNHSAKSFRVFGPMPPECGTMMADLLHLEA